MTLQSLLAATHLTHQRTDSRVPILLSLLLLLLAVESVVSLLALCFCRLHLFNGGGIAHSAFVVSSGVVNVVGVVGIVGLLALVNLIGLIAFTTHVALPSVAGAVGLVGVVVL